MLGQSGVPWGRVMLSGSLLEKSGSESGHVLDFGAAGAMCPTVTIRPVPEHARNPRVASLTAAERECLRLVYQHMTSKDIARKLDVSPHTVDMRLRNAIRKLEVQSRIEAARALVADEGLPPAIEGAAPVSGYQPLIYQASQIEDAADSTIVGAPASTGSGATANRSSDPNPLNNGSLARTSHQSLTRPDAGPSGGSLAQPGALAGNVASGSTLATDWPGIAAPDPGIGARPFLTTRPWGQRNDLAIGHRLGWMMFIALASALTFGGVLAALAALKTLI